MHPPIGGAGRTARGSRRALRPGRPEQSRRTSWRPCSLWMRLTRECLAFQHFASKQRRRARCSGHPTPTRSARIRTRSATSRLATIGSAGCASAMAWSRSPTTPCSQHGPTRRPRTRPSTSKHGAPPASPTPNRTCSDERLRSWVSTRGAPVQVQEVDGVGHQAALYHIASETRAHGQLLLDPEIGDARRLGSSARPPPCA